MRAWVETDRTRRKPYRARIKLDNGEYGPSERFASKRNARARLAEQQVEVARGSWVDPSRGKLLFRDWYAVFVATEINLIEGTRVNKESRANKWILPAFGHRPLGAITKPEVQAWVTTMAKSLKPGSVRQVYATFSKSMRAAVAAEPPLLVRSPCRDIVLPAAEPDEQRFLTLSELQALADALPPLYRVTAFLGGMAGLRLGEMGGLRRDRVDLFAGRITVIEQVREIRGRLSYGSVKTKASRRTVPIGRVAVQEIELHLRRFPLGPGGLLLASPTFESFRPHKFRSGPFNAAAERAGLEGVHPHSLRHTAVALWIAGGANPKQIQGWAGHSKLSTTYDLYGHLFPDSHLAAIAAVDDAYDEAQQKVVRLA